jgi:hypothetical protein
MPWPEPARYQDRPRHLPITSAVPGPWRAAAYQTLPGHPL